MPLTHVKITSAKPRPKPYKLADAQQLYLFVRLGELQQAKWAELDETAAV